MTGFSGVVLGVLFVALLGVLAVAAWRRSGAATVNAAASVVLAAPAVVVAVPVGPTWGGPGGSALALWLTVAGLLHSLGMLGPYDTVWWWDHLTHTVSAALVAALVYAVLLAAAGVGPIPALSPVGVAAATVLGTFGAGVFWELVELAARAVGDHYGVDPVLVVYDWQDTALDLAFDTAGALVVLALDVRLFVALVERDPSLAATALAWTAAVVTVASLGIAALVDLRPQSDSTDGDPAEDTD